MRSVLLALALVVLGGCKLTNTHEESWWLPRDDAYVWEQARAVAREQPRWTEVKACPVLGTLQFESTTALLRFTDDVKLSVGPENGGTRLTIWSGSRVGHSDFGANRKRIYLYLDALQRRLAAEPVP